MIYVSSVLLVWGRGRGMGKGNGEGEGEGKGKGKGVEGYPERHRIGIPMIRISLRERRQRTTSS